MSEQTGAVFLLEGEDETLRSRAIQEIVQTGTPERARVEHTLLEGERVEELLSPDLLSSPQQPLLRVLHGYGKLTPAQRKRVLSLLPPPPGLSICLPLSRLGAKDPLRALSALQRRDCARPQGRGWLQLCQRVAAELPRQLERGAAEQLLSACGEDAGLLCSELEKLHSALEDGLPITAHTVSALNADQTPLPVWQWVNAWCAGDLEQSVRALARLESGDESLAFLAAGGLCSRVMPAAWRALGVPAESLGYSPRAGQDLSGERALAALGPLARLEADLRGGSRLDGMSALALFTRRSLPA